MGARHTLDSNPDSHGCEAGALPLSYPTILLAPELKSPKYKESHRLVISGH